MSDHDAVSAADTMGEDIVSQRLSQKDNLAEKLFKNFRTSKCGPEDGVRWLSFNPGTSDEPLDKLTFDSKNADIFTSQCWAALKAREVFAQIHANQNIFEKLSLPKHKQSDLPEIDRFDLTIVGSSVSGLTFHATLHYLFEESDLDVALDDWFKINYIDSHQRPLQRLLQARDRRIVPRFEYERLLNYDFSTIPKDRTFKRDKIRPFLKRKSQDLVDAWNDTGQIKSYDPLTGILTNGTLFMPRQLCWQAGKVRSVAKQLLNGFNEITGGSHFKEHPGKGKDQSSTGGPIYLGTYKSDTQTRRASSQETMRLQLQTINNTQVGEEDSQTANDIGTDFVLIATGPGVDISHIGANKFKKNPKKHYLVNSQGSFWNAPKMELDVVEPDGKQVLVLGNGDSAAGAIYSTLFQDSQACSYRFLSHLLGHPDYREWFSTLQLAVQNKSKLNDTVTETWNRALKEEDVLAVMYTFPKAASDLKLEPDDNADSSNYPTRFMELLRTSVTVSLAMRPEQGNHVKLENEDEPFAFVEYPVDSSEHDLKQRLLRGAWPENRIIGALLHNQLKLYQIASDHHDNIIEIAWSGHNERLGKRFRYAVPLFKVKETRMSVRGDPKETEHIFKYVLDCRGPSFFSLKGNFAHTTEDEVESSTDDSFWVRLRKRIWARTTT